MKDMPWVMVPIGQYAHQDLGLKISINTFPMIVDFNPNTLVLLDGLNELLSVKS
jgi:hypothetical protein